MNNKWYSKKLNLLNYMICAKQYKFYYIVEEWYKFILLLRSHIKYKEKHEKRERENQHSTKLWFTCLEFN